MPSGDRSLPAPVLMVDEGLELRQAMPDDAEEMFVEIEGNREYLREWLPWLDDITSPENEMTFLRGTLREYEKGDGVSYGIRLVGRYIGGMGLNWIDRGNRACGIGFWLSEKFTGQGIVTRCCARLMDHCFDDLEFHRFVLEAATDNTASRAVAERLGMRLEGITKDREWLYDHYVDAALYAITAPEWRQRNQG